MYEIEMNCPPETDTCATGPRDRYLPWLGHTTFSPLATYPWVVEAVTLTTMMVALVRICCRFSLFLHLSRLLPSSWGRRGNGGMARRLGQAPDSYSCSH